MCSYYIPFWSYGLGVASVSGKTEDLFAASLAVYSCNIMIHNAQMFLTIRNYTKWFALTCTISVVIFFPIFLIAADFIGETLYQRMEEIIV